MGLETYLAACPELARLTSQNGWIDNATLRIKVLAQGGGWVRAAVQFEEVVMEGAGCVADRKACFGLVRAELNGEGAVTRLEIL